MSIPEIGTAHKPMHVVLSSMKPPTAKEAIGLTLVTLAPIALAVLMQKPALRQALAMRASHYGKQFCQWQIDTWTKGHMICAMAYNKARL
jgi:hypothetical protein